jgi:hypothetical protein
MNENEDAVNVYMMARNQVIVSPAGGAIDIYFPSVKMTMDVLGVQDQKDCFVKVRELFFEFRPREGE